MILSFGGEDFLLHPSGILYWPSRNTAIVSDLHLEKGSHHARRGFLLPPYDSRDTLECLIKNLENARISRVILLGDCFHDAAGFARLGKQEQVLFARILQYDCVWVEGNHDAGYSPEGIIPHDVWQEGQIIFRHQATMKENSFEISGHFHPKAHVRHKGGKITRPCFIEDGRKMILPSFGAYTGGLDVRDKAIADHFPNSFNCHMLGQEKIYTLHSTILEK